MRRNVNVEKEIEEKQGIVEEEEEEKEEEDSSWEEEDWETLCLLTFQFEF